MFRAGTSVRLILCCVLYLLAGFTTLKISNRAVFNVYICFTDIDNFIVGLVYCVDFLR